VQLFGLAVQALTRSAGLSMHLAHIMCAALQPPYVHTSRTAAACAKSARFRHVCPETVCRRSSTSKHTCNCHPVPESNVKSHPRHISFSQRTAAAQHNKVCRRKVDQHTATVDTLKQGTKQLLQNAMLSSPKHHNAPPRQQCRHNRHTAAGSKLRHTNKRRTPARLPDTTCIRMYATCAQLCSKVTPSAGSRHKP
jgi:hypothetical protein